MDTAFHEHRCSRCDAPADGPAPFTVSRCCAAPLSSFYDAARADELLPRAGTGPVPGLWRYRAVLPLPADADPVSLGEGGTPLLEIPRTSAALGGRLLLKDESANPTGSFKDRGLSVAVSLASAAGVRGLVLPTAGNAGASAAAYGARAGMTVSVHAPETTPSEILAEIRLRGARLTLHPGSIADAGRFAASEAAENGFLPVATFREPGRVEGKKSMGYELFEQMEGAPDAIVYPCGGGTGIVAMAQAFDELRAMGRWTGPPPRMFAVQCEGCAPVVRAFAAGNEAAEPWENPTTFAAGLRVPVAFADRLILGALRRTGGGALAVTDDEAAREGRDLARRDGLLPCPEGAAALAGARHLLEDGTLGPDDRVVVFQTGSALKYLEDWRRALDL